MQQKSFVMSNVNKCKDLFHRREDVVHHSEANLSCFLYQANIPRKIKGLLSTIKSDNDNIALK